MANTCILSCQGVYKSYKMGKSRLEVLKGVDLAVGDGEFIAVEGSSGSGKSTLLHILGGLDRPDKGGVFFEGKALTGLSSGKINEFRNKKTGFVFQFYHLLDELTVAENVLLAAMAQGSAIGWLGRAKTAGKRAEYLLEQMGLADRRAHRPFELSGGERQRAAIARALMNEPKILLADEPTGNLDCRTGNGILKVLERLHRDGQTIVMVTHDERIAACAQRRIRLADGRIVGQ